MIETLIPIYTVRVVICVLYVGIINYWKLSLITWCGDTVHVCIITGTLLTLNQTSSLAECWGAWGSQSTVLIKNWWSPPQSSQTKYSKSTDICFVLVETQCGVYTHECVGTTGCPCIYGAPPVQTFVVQRRQTGKLKTLCRLVGNRLTGDTRQPNYW